MQHRAYPYRMETNEAGPGTPTGTGTTTGTNTAAGTSAPGPDNGFGTGEAPDFAEVPQAVLDSGTPPSGPADDMTVVALRIKRRGR